jgi:hypothetical protein
LDLNPAFDAIEKDRIMTTKPTIIHVRFAPDGTVTEIGERPEALSSQQWYDKLTGTFGTKFEALSGGRGVFRAAPDELEALKAAVLQ